MNRWLSRHCIWPLSERLCGRDTRRRLQALRKADAFDAARLRGLQTRKLRRLLRHAVENSPYYRARFARTDLRPVFAETDEHATLWECFQQLPLLTREQICQHREAMVWPAARKRLIPCATGGSSGEPLQFYIDPPRAAADWAARWRARAWWGLRPGDPEVLLWGGPVRDSWRDRLRRWRDRSLNQHVISAFDLSAGSMATYVEQIRALCPACVYGYASSLALLARFALEANGDRAAGPAAPAPPLHHPDLRAVFTTGEVLTPHDREAIAAAFGAPVVQEYGCRDGGLLGCACPAGSLHIPVENVIVEILDESGRPVPPGHAGDVVITHLEAFSMPIIRYRNGDVAVMAAQPCPCGRSSPVIAEVQGRRSDHVVVRRGQHLVHMHALALIYVIREVAGVRQFRIHQPSLDRLEVDLVPGPRFTSDHQKRILSGLLERMGPGVRVDIRHRTHLDPLPSGKHVCVTSDVKDGMPAAAVELTRPHTCVQTVQDAPLVATATAAEGARAIRS